DLRGDADRPGGHARVQRHHRYPGPEARHHRPHHHGPRGAQPRRVQPGPGRAGDRGAGGFPRRDRLPGVRRDLDYDEATGGMDERHGSGEQFPPGDGAEELPESRPPHRLIGPPPPARARTLLEAPPQEDRRPERWLPAGPSNLDQAKRAERLVAALFILSMLASIGFVAAYVGLEVHSVVATQR